MQHRKITEHKVRSAKPGPKRITITEDGLAFEIHPSGRKSFYVRLRQNGRLHKELLGHYPPHGTMTVREAREKVRALQHAKAQGAAVKQSSATFREFVNGPFADWCLAQRRDGKSTMARLRALFMYRSLLEDRIARLEAEPEDSPRRAARLREARLALKDAADSPIADKRLRDITPEDVEGIKNAFVREYKPATVKRNLGDLRRVFSKAVEWDYLRRSPATRVSDPKVDRLGTKLYLSEAELARLHDALDLWDYRSTFPSSAAERRDHPAYFPTLVHLAINTGLRKGELLALRWCDIDHETKMVTVRGTHAKNAQTRQVPISDKLLQKLSQGNAAFAEFDSDDFDSDARIFPVDSFRKPWERLMRYAKLNITPHHLRHHFASMLVLRGTALHVVQRLLGHADISTTQRYLSVRTEDAFEAVNLL